MTNEEAYKLLKLFNAWRRDNNVPSKYNMPNPTDIGVAIDIALEVLREKIIYDIKN